MARHDGGPDSHSYHKTLAGESGPEQEEQGDRRPGSSGRNGRSSPVAIFNPYYTGRPRTPANGHKHASIDRQEIIRRIKSGGSRPASPELERPSSRASSKRSLEPERSSAAQNLLIRPKSPEIQQDNTAAGLRIERPRSALHRGDFRERSHPTSSFDSFGDATTDPTGPSLSTSPVAPWHPSFPSAGFRAPRQTPLTPPGLSIQRPARARAVSNAPLAASFVYKPPTSPLVQASRPDTPEPPARQKSRSPDKSRRHTFSPQYLQRFQSSLDYPTSARYIADERPPPLRSEKTFPYQAHQPRRSLHSFASLPHTPVGGTRRPSLSETPLHHAPMVGSYEESILRGRMSTTPSKPLNFVAQIGVLGRGDCKPNLRCPPHATVPFPAVFYSYGASGRASGASDQPSPYVGLVDLENHLPVPEASPEKRRQRRTAALSDEGSRASSQARGENSASEAQARRRRHKQKRRSGSPKAPPGGSYRIPQQGQLQIVIKNPHKTAVKLFLVPYDLTDMEPGQKTFIRQRSYSAGPIIDMPLASRRNLGTDRPEASLSNSDDPNDRPMLRYLVHLHICCPSRGRFFLYKSVRVVFANRVPDGKEKLRNEIQLPEPRYSTYKPGRDSNVGLSAANSPKDGITANDNRRRSAIDSTNHAGNEGIYHAPAPITPSPRPVFPQAHSMPCTEFNPAFHVSRLPLPSFAPPTLDSRPTSRHNMSEGDVASTTMTMDVDSGSSSQGGHTWDSMLSPTTAGSSSTASREDSNPVKKRLEDPFDFPRERSREGRTSSGRGGRSESLLSRRLRDLAFPPGGGNAGEE